MALMKNKVNKESLYIENKISDKHIPLEYISEKLSKVEYEYFTSSFYEEKMNVSSLTDAIAKRNWGAVEDVINKKRKNEKSQLWGINIVLFSWLVSLIGTMGIAFLQQKSLVNFKHYDKFVEFLAVGGLIVFISFGISVLFMDYMNKRSLQKLRKKEILLDKKIYDEEGDSIKLIWFLYHNLSFKDESEKVRFLVRNYERLNGDIKIVFKNGVSVKDCVENYLKEGLQNWQKNVEKDRAENKLKELIL